MERPLPAVARRCPPLFYQRNMDPNIAGSCRLQRISRDRCARLAGFIRARCTWNANGRRGSTYAEPADVQFQHKTWGEAVAQSHGVPFFDLEMRRKRKDVGPSPGTLANHHCSHGGSTSPQRPHPGQEHPLPVPSLSKHQHGKPDFQSPGAWHVIFTLISRQHTTH